MMIADFEKLIWYFLIYGFLGWCVEVIYAALLERRFVNRGFLSGPICPIYGFGVLLVLNLLEPFQRNVFLLFFGSVVITSSIELIGGLLMEQLFHQRWWDYSDKPFNLKGYICLSFSLMWGLACLIVVDRVNPMVVRLVTFIPLITGRISLAVLGVLFTADMVATVSKVMKLNAKLKTIEEITGKLRTASDDIGTRLADKAIAVAEKTEELREHRQSALEKLYLEHKRLLMAFPSMRSLRHRDTFNELKELWKERRS